MKYSVQGINNPVVVMVESPVEEVIGEGNNPYREVFALGYCPADNNVVPLVLSVGNGAGDDRALCEGDFYKLKREAISWLLDLSSSHKHEHSIIDLAEWMIDNIESEVE